MKKVIFLLTYLLGISFGTFAQKVIVLNPEQDYFPIGYDQALYLEDANHTITFEQIRQIPDDKFSVPTTEYTSFGVTKSAYWVKFKMANQQKTKFYIRINHPVLDTAELYVLKGQDLVMKKEILAKKYEIQVPNSPFLLPHYEQDTLTCYIRVAANTPLALPIYLLSDSKISGVVFRQTLPDILFFGAVLVMVLYNLFIGITTWNRAYFYYVGNSFTIGLVVFFLKGYPVVLMGKYHFLINDYFALIVAMAAIFLGFFTINFLQLSTNYPKGKRMLEISSALHLLAGFIFLAGYINLNVLLYQIFNIYTNISILFISIYLYFYKKYQPAKLFLIAFSVFLAFSTIMNLILAGLFPVSMLTLYSLDIGSTAELVLFSIALGDKINSYRKETLKAQAENLQLVKEQNVVLEQKVTERTLALNETNEELNSTLHTVEKQRDNIISSINYALRIQNAIIPKESEIQRIFPESFVFFRPKDIVSGDFYWFAEKETRVEGQEIRKKYILAVADCTGHGVSGAFMTMIGNNILNQIVNDQEIYEPDQILNQMSPLLAKTLLHSEGKIADGMDISILTIEKRSSTSLRNDISMVSYAGAMNPLYYVQNKEFREIKADKKPIGGKIEKDFSYQKHEISIERQEEREEGIKNENLSTLSSQLSPLITIYLCSDGFQDQFGGTENRKFMVGNFKKMLFGISEKPMREQGEILAHTFDAWKGNYKQTDDVAVIGIRV
ncbi:MAG: hypothetical protein EAZ97_13730 [Bacteroidetes bacterium]|nr:MAG: hypothetical protein EAZ97_13730 [Bacteroidota bacterium]